MVGKIRGGKGSYSQSKESREKSKIDSFLQKKISNRFAYTIISLVALALVAFVIYAAEGNPSSNPGHPIEQIDPPSRCSAGEVLKWDGGSWVCDRTTSPYILSTMLYQNTGRCNLGYTKDSNAITTIGSCSGSGGSCGGTYQYNGVSCRIYHGNPTACEAIDSCYYCYDNTGDCQGKQGGCYDLRNNISGVSCSNFPTQEICEAVGGGCSWTPGSGSANTPLGRLVTFQ